MTTDEQFAPPETISVDDKDMLLCPRCGQHLVGDADLTYTGFKVGWNQDDTFRFDVEKGDLAFKTLTSLTCEACGWTTWDPQDHPIKWTIKGVLVTPTNEEGT